MDNHVFSTLFLSRIRLILKHQKIFVLLFLCCAHSEGFSATVADEAQVMATQNLSYLNEETLYQLQIEAEAGNPKAQHEFARQLERKNINTSAQNNNFKIVDWYTKAANQGYLPSQETLGLIYMKDTYVDKDYIQAYKWFSLAAAQNGPIAMTAIEVLLTMMTPEQVQAGKKLVHQWENINP